MDLQVNQFITMSDDEISEVFYGKNPYRHNGLVLIQCSEIGAIADKAYTVCIYSGVTLEKIVRDLIDKVSMFTFFGGYDGRDGKGGIVTWWSRQKSVYTSIFVGVAMDRDSVMKQEYKRIGLFIAYLYYLLVNGIDKSRWMRKSVAEAFYNSLKELEITDIPFDMIRSFNPDMIV